MARRTVLLTGHSWHYLRRSETEPRLSVRRVCRRHAVAPRRHGAQPVVKLDLDVAARSILVGADHWSLGRTRRDYDASDPALPRRECVARARSSDERLPRVRPARRGAPGPGPSAGRAGVVAGGDRGRTAGGRG